MKIKFTRALKKSKRFGKISRMELPDKSRIYISKKGWTLRTPKMNIKKLQKIINRIKIDKYECITIPFSEINLAINETIKQGYVIKDNKPKTKRRGNLTSTLCIDFSELRNRKRI